MGKKTSAVDDYISRAQPFAQPILKHLRELFHEACPDVEEKIKWNVPFYEYKGILGATAGFKHYATWGLWKAKLIKPLKAGLPIAPTMNAGKLTALKDLPPKKMVIDMIRQAVALNEAGVKPAKKDPKKRPEAKVPKDLAAALKSNARASRVFKEFPPSHRREYVDWIEDAKRDETRQKRIALALEMLTEGKSRNWKYEKR